MPKAIAVRAEDTTFLVEIDEAIETPTGHAQAYPPRVGGDDGIPPGTEPVSNVRRIERQFPEVEAMIVACCKGLHKAIAHIPTPDKFAVEFGIKFGGEAGLPVVTKVSGECNFKVTIEWKAP